MDRETKPIFLEAIDLQKPLMRARYLDQYCAGDAELRAQVKRLRGQDSSTTKQILPSSQPAEPFIARTLVENRTGA